MTVITLATVGYGETHPLSVAGRIYTIFLILAGMGVLLYGVSSMTAFFVEGELQAILRRRKMRRTVKKLSGHAIVCGAGRTGRHVIEELKKTRTPFVVIEADPKEARALEDEGVIVVHGDATQEEAMREAGVEKAGRMVVCLTEDKDNLFVVLSARGLNGRMRIVTRYVDENSMDKLKRAGADAVVSPNAIGGLRMASEALRPAVVSFLDTMLRSTKGTLRVAEAAVQNGSRMANRAIAAARITDRTGLLVLSLRGTDGGYLFNPPGQTVLKAGCTLIVMGDVDGVKKLQAMASGKRSG